MTTATAPSALKEDFEAKGFVGPLPVFDKQACRRFVHLLEDAQPPLDWPKGSAASSRVFYEIGTHRAVLDQVEALLGPDVMLWGARLARRMPGKVHPWHTDLETSGATGGTISVWIGLENTNVHSALHVVSHSHRFGVSLQEQAQRVEKTYGGATTQDVIAWAKEHDAQSQVEYVAAGDGEAIFFDGRLWHGSHNTNGKMRTALLLQYAVPDRPIRMPDAADFQWPFHFLDVPNPPCVMVRGTSLSSANRIVVPPPRDHGSGPLHSSCIRPMKLPLGEDEQTGWKAKPLFRGATRCMTHMSCHASALSPGVTPHPPHVHPEEELLIMLSGQAELVVVDDGPPATETIHPVGPGSFIYYPSYQRHTIRSVGTEPTEYLMFKWLSDEAVNEGPTEAKQPLLETKLYQFEAPVSDDKGKDGFAKKHIFEGPTRYLRKLQCHLSTLQPGSGYPPHVDAYDVAILVLSGTVETLGQRVEPHGLIFYSAGKPHGMKNVGDTPASYLVFEFHDGESGPPAPSIKDIARKQLRRYLPQPVKDLAKKGISLVRG
ncbi:MAG: cupin domain-containing protein [Rhodothermales bacterium]